jgi:hypothetical protein
MGDTDSGISSIEESVGDDVEAAAILVLFSSSSVRVDVEGVGAARIAIEHVVPFACLGIHLLDGMG